MYSYPRLREVREDSDKTQEEIAKIIHTSQKQLSRWERGEREFPAHIIKELCLYYGVSADYILDLPKNLDYPER